MDDFDENFDEYIYYLHLYLIYIVIQLPHILH